MRSNPFVVNISDVLRSDGGSREIRIEAPVDWHVELSAVLPEPPLTAILDATRVSGGVLFRGSASTRVRHTCHRCLDAWDEDVVVRFAQLFSDVGDAAEEDDYTLEGELVDLEPLLRDEVLLAMPISPTCPEGCREELVAGSGSDLNTDSPADDAGGASPFAVLKDLLGD